MERLFNVVLIFAIASVGVLGLALAVNVMQNGIPNGCCQSEQAAK